MKIKQQYIGCKIYIKRLDINIEIEDNPSMFAHYLQLGLKHIFEDDKNNKRTSKYSGVNTD